MHGKRPVFRCRHALAMATLSLGLACHGTTLAAGLDLPAAEQIALLEDPSVSSIQARVSALEELQVAAGQLPDPMLRFGMMSLPTNTFDLGQEAMTQVQFGVVQTFPRGQTRALRSAQIREQAGALEDRSRDLALMIRRAVREEYFEILKHQHLAAINRNAEAAFTELERLTHDYYATGRVQQQDVLRAAVELARVRERALRITEDEQRARGRLAAWIGDIAWRELASGWPSLQTPGPLEHTRDRLIEHPRILALHREIGVANRGVELAEQSFKPEFAVDLTYGGRGGLGADGRGRPDLLSLMVRMDLPLFTGNRQDRVHAARIAESAAAAFDRDDELRRLRSEVFAQANVWQRQMERLELFESSLLPEAEFNARASFDAYQAALEDMTTLIRAQIIEFDLQLDYVRLKAESLKSQARLLYLEGK